MPFLVIFFIQLILLFLLSRRIHIHISQFIFQITRSKKITVYLIWLLFLPGTLLHELAHWLTAKLLFVQTGSISLIPKLSDESLKLGSVRIEKTDLLRRNLIGMAPVFWGLGILLFVLYIAAERELFKNYWMIIFIAYISFEIGNTMFSSRKDMEGAVPLLALLILLGIIAYFLNFRIPYDNIEHIFSHSYVSNLFQKASLYLLFPIIFDILIILLLKLLRK
jgi:hypothetical protein